MTSNKNIVGFLFICLVLGLGCGQSEDGNQPSEKEKIAADAIIYHNQILQLQGETGAAAAKFRNEMDNGDSTSMVAAYVTVFSVADSCLRVLNADEGFMGDTTLRDAMTKVFDHYLQTIKFDYASLLSMRIKSELSPEDLQQTTETLEKITANDEKEDALFRTVQNEFLMKHTGKPAADPMPDSE